MVVWHGNLFFRVYSPDKPIKYGLKAYMLCDAENAYCLKFKLYEERSSVRPSENCATYDRVMDLLRNYCEKGKMSAVDRNNQMVENYKLNIKTLKCLKKTLLSSYKCGHCKLLHNLQRVYN